jgi:predicted aspartyl protease
MLLPVVLLVIVSAVASADAAKDAPASKPPSDGSETAQPEPLYADRTRADHAGRILVDVQINGQGPLRFIVDTGANRSALAPGVAERLALPYVAGGVVETHGITGAAMLPAVDVESLRAGDLVFPPTALPVLPGDIFGGADGFLGVAGLPNMRLDVDFGRNRVWIGPSNGKRASNDFIAVPATLWQGGLLLVNGNVGSIPVKVIIDTGAERTMGNLKLRAAIVERSSENVELETTVRGATMDVGAGTYFNAPTISIGPARLQHLPVTFADLHVFELWGLTGEPALVVGMDVLGTLERFVVDYRRREFQMKPQGGTGAVLRRCTASTCGSRIPEGAR